MKDSRALAWGTDRKGWVHTMRANSNQGLVTAFLLLLTPVGVTGCSSESKVMAPETQADAILAAMEVAIQDEYRAELIYQRVLDDFGSVLPFRNIINAEVRHSQAIAGLYVTRGLPVPASRWASDEIPAFPSIPAACQAGVVAEIENIEIYDQYLALPLPADVLTVFTNNRAASLQAHLPAFQRCS